MKSWVKSLLCKIKLCNQQVWFLSLVGLCEERKKRNGRGKEEKEEERSKRGGIGEEEERKWIESGKEVEMELRESEEGERRGSGQTKCRETRKEMLQLDPKEQPKTNRLHYTHKHTPAIHRISGVARNS